MNQATQPDTQPHTSLPPRRAFTIHAAAEYCACRCSAIETAIHDGLLRAKRLGRGIIIVQADLDRFIDDLPFVEPHVSRSVAERRAARLANKEQENR